MNKKVIIIMLLIVCLVFPLAGVPSQVHAQEPEYQLPVLEPYLSADGLTMYNDPSPLVITADTDPAMQGIQFPAEELAGPPPAVGSTFQFTYIAAGGKDPWGQKCQAFPAKAKTAFNAAAAIWAARIKSTVPIKIKACWANLGSPSILGYSGALSFSRDFVGAPKVHTWYYAALANSLAKKDLVTAEADDGITFNSGFAWYYGTDGKTPAGKYDLVTVATHEIGHGLNFAGLAGYAGGKGNYGYKGYPSIYDRFMESNSGKAVTSYANPSVALGNLYKSNSLWFDAPNAKAANAGKRVKMYAPSVWSGGSSYSHLDYNTFKNTINKLMVYAIGSGSSQHNPGNVTLAILKDLGWKLMP
jgi:hypothetical protein